MTAIPFTRDINPDALCSTFNGLIGTIHGNVPPAVTDAGSNVWGCNGCQKATFSGKDCLVFYYVNASSTSTIRIYYSKALIGTQDYPILFAGSNLPFPTVLSSQQWVLSANQAYCGVVQNEFAWPASSWSFSCSTFGPKSWQFSVRVLPTAGSVSAAGILEYDCQWAQAYTDQVANVPVGPDNPTTSINISVNPVTVGSGGGGLQPQTDLVSALDDLVDALSGGAGNTAIADSIDALGTKVDTAVELLRNLDADLTDADGGGIGIALQSGLDALTGKVDYAGQWLHTGVVAMPTSDDVQAQTTAIGDLGDALTAADDSISGAIDGVAANLEDPTVGKNLAEKTGDVQLEVDFSAIVEQLQDLVSAVQDGAPADAIEAQTTQLSEDLQDIVSGMPDAGGTGISSVVTALAALTLATSTSGTSTSTIATKIESFVGWALNPANPWIVGLKAGADVATILEFLRKLIVGDQTGAAIDWSAFNTTMQDVIGVQLAGRFDILTDAVVAAINDPTTVRQVRVANTTGTELAISSDGLENAIADLVDIIGPDADGNNLAQALTAKELPAVDLTQVQDDLEAISTALGTLTDAMTDGFLVAGETTVTNLGTLAPWLKDDLDSLAESADSEQASAAAVADWLADHAADITMFLSELQDLVDATGAVSFSIDEKEIPGMSDVAGDLASINSTLQAAMVPAGDAFLKDIRDALGWQVGEDANAYADSLRGGLKKIGDALWVADEDGNPTIPLSEMLANTSFTVNWNGVLFGYPS